jgi:transglutaminase-like putative cysteine protease
MVRIKTVLDILACAVALLGFLPLFPYLGLMPRVLFLVALVGGWFADRRGYVLNTRLSTAISIVLFLLYSSQFSRSNLVVPAANLLTVLMAVRLASEKSARHYLQGFALALFGLASYSLFNLSAVFLVYLFLLLVLLGIALVILTFYSENAETSFTRSGLRWVMGEAAFLPLAAIPLMLFFFFILPRTQYPLWNFLNGAAVQTTGVSDTVRPGRTATAGEVKTVAFRAQMPRLGQNQLYWRAIVLNSYKGSAWVRQPPPAGEEGRPTEGEKVAQTIYPEPSGSSFLVTLNLPLRLSGARESFSPDLVVTRTAPGGRRGKYEAVSGVGGTVAAPRGIDRGFYVALPDTLSPRLRAVARTIAQQQGDAARLRALETWYRDGKFLYATTGMPTGDDPIDAFLFTKRRGNCEFFASSAALILRAAGVPTRLVGGYYGGIYNELGNYYVVSDDMAHVWLEVYIVGKGWETVDPSGWARNAAVLGERGRLGLLRKVQLAVDAAGYFWNLTVINYDLERQVQILNRANSGLRRLSWPSIRTGHPYYLLLVAVPAAAWFLLLRRRRVSAEARLLKDFLRRVERVHHFTLPPASGLYDLAAALNRPEIDAFVSLYCRSVYRDRALSREKIRQLRRLVDSVG